MRVVTLSAAFAALLMFVLVESKDASAQDATAFNAAVTPTPYSWSGLYVGGHLGYAWGSSNWTTPPGISGSLNLGRPIDTFNETGSFFEGVQAGYNYMLANRILLGAEVDATFPSFQNLSGISIGGTSNFMSPTLGPVSYSETVLSSGTVRGRIGYAPGSWLFYATGGFAWTYNQQTLTEISTGNRETPFLWRLGWAAGTGVETPIAPHWTARLEYLFTDHGRSTHGFGGGAQPITWPGQGAGTVGATPAA